MGQNIRFLVFIIFAQMSLINTHVDIYSRASSLYFGLSLYLNLYFVYVRSKDSGETGHMYDLVWAFVA